MKVKSSNLPQLLKTGLLLVLLLGISKFHGQAQDTTSTQPVPMSLQRCISYALTHNANSINARLDEAIAQARVKELVGVGLPQISGKIDYQNLVIIPNSVVDITQFPGDPANPLPDNLPDELKYQAAQFAIPQTLTAGLSASQLLYDGSFFVGVKAARELVNLTSKTTEKTDIDVAVDISKAYYNVLVAEEQARILDINVKRVKDLLDNTTALYKEGFVEEIDVDRLEINFNNLQLEQQKVERYKAVSRALLKFQMGMDLNREIILTDVITDIEELPSIEDLTPSGNEYQNRVEYTMLKQQRYLQELNAKRYRIGRFGNLVAFGGYNFQAIRPDFSFFDFDRWDFLPDSYGGWYSNAVVGIQYNITLFDGRITPSKVKQVELEMDKITVNTEAFKMAVGLETANASTAVKNAWTDLKSGQRNVELAQKVYEVTQIKYKEGVGSNLEVLDAESTLRESQTNYLSALYQYQLALIDLRKAKGEIIVR